MRTCHPDAASRSSSWLRTASASCAAACAANSRSSSSNAEPSRTASTEPTIALAPECGHGQHAGRAGACGRASRGLRQSAPLHERSGSAGRRELGAERGAPRRDRARLEQSVPVEHAQDDGVGGERHARGAHEHLERRAQVTGGGDADGRLGERLDGHPSPFDHHLPADHAWIDQPIRLHPWPSLHADPLPRSTTKIPRSTRSTIERAYRRERARRRARVERRHAARRSGLRFWSTILVLCFLAAVVVLATWHQVQSLFGV